MCEEVRVCEEGGVMYLLSHAGEQQPIHSLQSGDGPLLLLVVQTLGEEEGEEGKGEEEREGEKGEEEEEKPVS